MRMGKFEQRKRLMLVLGSVVVLAGLVGVIIAQRLELERSNNSDPVATAEQARIDAERLAGKVSKIQQIPDEMPTLATVQDADKLKEQEFFKDAKNGDKVLIFTNAKKAIIYREADNSVINSGPIVLSAEETSQS